jgi:von Willebrand factor type A domain
MLAALLGASGGPLRAAPLDAALTALARPLDGGAGRSFAAFSGSAASPAATRSPRGAQTPHKPRIVASDSGPTEVHLDIEYPAEGSVVANAVCGVLVAGRAHALRGSEQRFDVVMVLDTSQSTANPTQADINGNGVIGHKRLGILGSIFGSGSTDPSDSILAAEVAAARQVLRGLDPRNTRIAVVAFAGDPSPSGGGSRARRAAHTLEPLTRKYARIQRALDDLLQREPEGSTHMAAGVDQAIIELLGLRGAASRPDARAEKIVFFFTDGQPTLPYGPEMEADNVRAVLRAADRARRGGIRIHAFAIGPDALDGPLATVEMASRTGGSFMPVRHPGDLVNLVADMSFTKLDAMEIMNDTTKQSAHLVRVTADGDWAGLLPMRPGVNRIRVRARADDGALTERTRTVTFVPDAPTPPIPEAYLMHRNRLLEDCLHETKQMRLQAERDHAEQVRRELQLEIERERATARERANAQRKRLELEPDRGKSGDAHP